jgi:DNA-binding CsgD family transcriptional regulator
VAELTDRQGLGEPGVVCWQPDLVEAEIHLGEVGRAECALARFETEALAVKRTWALAAVARYRGLMAPDGEFEPHFTRALELHRITPTPFDLARTELCLGERLRRSGERRAARDQLTLALERFRRLGAEPWAVRAETELAAAGAKRARAESHRPDRPVQEVLTAQELQVAIAVAEGNSNKEVAAALFISSKTVEYHLGHIYRKLDIRSRTQLAHKMTRASESTPAGYASGTPVA